MSGPIVLVLRLLLTISLYGFLVWALVSLWRDIRLQSALLAVRNIPPIILSFARAGQVTETRRFRNAQITIGRDPACECPVDDDAMSARHARLSYHHNQWWLEDLDSTNGIHLNQEVLDVPTVVITGDEFLCGSTLFTVNLEGDFQSFDEESDPKNR